MNNATNMQVMLSADTQARLRDKARSVGAPIGALADLLLTYGLERVDDAALTRWALARAVRTRGREAGAVLRRPEAQAMDALGRLWAWEGWTATVTTHKRLARATGQLEKVTFDALRALEGRGLVAGVVSSEADRWGRPIESVWWRVDRALVSVDQGAVYRNVLQLRLIAQSGVIGPVERLAVEAWARESTGWEPDALALPWEDGSGEWGAEWRARVSYFWSGSPAP